MAYQSGSWEQLLMIILGDLKLSFFGRFPANQITVFSGIEKLPSALGLVPVNPRREGVRGRFGSLYF